jgi:predicted amidohydrolase YtcJ
MTARTADILLRNGNVCTLADTQPPAQAVAIRAGRILATGSDMALEGLAGSSTTVIDLGGRTVLPGLTDAHIHLEHYARHLHHVDCETPTLDECLDRVRERASKLPAGAWLLGHGWNHNVWGAYGTAAMLDTVSDRHPMYLTAKSLHAAWANSLAMRQAGITSDTQPPPGGAIHVDATGQPTGILLETAVDLVAAIIPEWDLPQLLHALHQAQETLLAFGLTAVHDFDGEHCHQALKLLRERGDLALRVVKHVPVELLDQAIARGDQTDTGDDWLRIGNIKVFADGALGPRTAAMLEPYRGDPGNHGLPQITRDELVDIGRKAGRNGLALAVHAIGDRANREVLDAFEDLRRHETAQRLPALRHRMEHLQLVHPDDLSRPASLHVVASMQPIHATSDYPMADAYWGERVATAYAWRSLLDRSTILAFGSDAPVESPNPFWGLHAAVSRRRRDGTPAPDGWTPAQRIRLGQALAAYTRGPAYAAGVEHCAGRLRRGFLADLIVLESDPFQLHAPALAELRPVGTMVDGVWRVRRF